MGDRRLPKLLAVALATVLLASSCTTSSDDQAVVVVTSTAPPAAPAPTAAAPVTVPTEEPGVVQTTDVTPIESAAPSTASVELTTTAVTPTTTTAPPKPAPPSPKIFASVKKTQKGVSPIKPVVFRTNGKFDSVKMTNPEGKEVLGELAKDRESWQTTEPLGYGRTYQVVIAAHNKEGGFADTSTYFTTLKPKGKIFPSFFPNPDMKTIGVGQPMVVIFDKAPKDRKAAEKALKVTTVPAVTGFWFWYDDRTLHYRPKEFWVPGTKITVNAKIYGVNLGGGMYGETDRTLSVRVGQAKIATIDNNTKQMTVTINGKVARTIPVSLGQDQTVTVKNKKISLETPSGIYVAQEKYKVKRMTSASYGLPASYELGYDSKIPLAVRISAGGIFVHSAPWSVASQGVENVSHGCINISPENAAWFYKNFSFGDVVIVKNAGPALKYNDGFGDWNVTWGKWRTGSAFA